MWLGSSEFDGIELLSEFKKIKSDVPVIIISGHGTVDMAVNAIKSGAYDFLEKPFKSEKIIILAKRAIESAKLLNENEKLKKITNPNIPLVGNSNFITNLKNSLEKISKSKSRILINGPMGSGKKFIAYCIHKYSNNAKNLLNIIDFRDLVNEDLEIMFTEKSENINQNLFVSSNNNTLVLNNIDLLPVSFQKKILNYLENDNYFNNFKINLNVKIIAITSKIIDHEISKGNFIRNLYDRLNVVNIKVPPINKRREDILPLCNYYLDYFNKNKKYNFILSKKASKQLEIYDWPGNIRQIINYIEKTIIINQEHNSKNDYELQNLPIDMGENDLNKSTSSHFDLSLKEARQNFEKEYLISQIKRFNGNIIKISEFTGMERTALYRKFKSLNITLDNK